MHQPLWDRLQRSSRHHEDGEKGTMNSSLITSQNRKGHLKEINFLAPLAMLKEVDMVMLLIFNALVYSACKRCTISDVLIDDWMKDDSLCFDRIVLGTIFGDLRS